MHSINLHYITLHPVGCLRKEFTFYLLTYFLLFVDAPLMAFRENVIKNLVFNKRPALVTHTNDISIHFQTSRDHGVLFATSNVANNDYMKAYIEDGHVHVDTFIERSGREVLQSSSSSFVCIIRLHQMHQVLNILADVRSVCLSYSLNHLLCGSIRCMPHVRGHWVQPLPNAFGLLLSLSLFASPSFICWEEHRYN